MGAMHEGGNPFFGKAALGIVAVLWGVSVAMGSGVQDLAAAARISICCMKVSVLTLVGKPII